MARMTGKDLAEAVGNFVNGASEDDIEEFVQFVTRGMHRTLQQLTFGVILKLVERWASLTEYQYDLRNQRTVEVSKQLLSGTDKYERHLPHI